MSETSRYRAIIFPVEFRQQRCQTSIAQGKTNSKQKSNKKDK